MGEQKPGALPNGYKIDQPVFVEAYRVFDDESEELCRRLGGRVMGGPSTDKQAVTVKLNEDLPKDSVFPIKHPVTFLPEPQWIQMDDGEKHQIRYQVVADKSA
jgi:hypothetical protein